MWTLQNVGQATGYRTFNKIDWFRQVTAKLLKEQQPNGLWKGPKGEIVSTSFALLYLARARGPLGICKLRFADAATPAESKAKPAGQPAKPAQSRRGRNDKPEKPADAADKPPAQDWNNRPNDMFNLVQYMSRECEVPVSWQIADIDQPVFELIETPVLYLATDNAFTLSKENIERLREYLDAGGTLVCVPEGRNVSDPQRSMKALATALFPQSELQMLRVEHPIFQLHRKLKSNIAVAAIGSDSRLKMFFVQRDIGRDLQQGSERSRDAFDLLTNIYLYATGMDPRRPRLQTNYVIPSDYPTRGSISAARIKTKGEYDPEPLALPQFQAFLAKFHGIELKLTDAAPSELKDQRVAFLTATRSSSLTDTEAAALRKWLDAGGTLWIDAVAGRSETATRLDAMVAQLSFKSSDVRSLPTDTPIYTGQGLPAGYDNRSITWRRFSITQGDRGTAPQLYGAYIGDRLAVVICRDDLTSGLAGAETWEISGYSPTSARRLVANGILELIRSATK
jgi:hypothetical protein